MSTITTLNAGDSGATSRSVINTNFSNLNTDKAETASPTFTGTVTLPTGLTGVLKATAGVVSVQSGLSPLTIETTSGTTHSLTTTAGQIVVVWAKGTAEITSGSGSMTVSLNYNGVAKDNVTVETAINQYRPPFALMYTETPGAGTQNITITATGGVSTSIADPVIIVMKIG